MDTDAKQLIRARFAEIAALPDDLIRLDEAALLIGNEADTAFSVDHYLGELDKLASRFREDARYHTKLGVAVSSLVSFLHQEAGFSGNVSNYYDPANSYLNRVIELRRGIPITLALVHIAIGKRLEIPIHGIAFPGHFLIHYGGNGGMNGAIVDPFSGRELSRTDCQTLLRQIAGPRATIKDEYFLPASNREVLIRILDNLKQIFWRQRQWDESKACIDRQILLLPKRDEFTVQLGAVYEMQGNASLAQHTYAEILRQTSDDQIRELASKRLLALDLGSRTIH